MSNASPKVKDDLQYAKDVLASYAFFGRSAGIDDLTPSALALHEYGATAGCKKDYLAMVAKATEMLQKHQKDTTPDDQIRAERKSIAELKNFLLAEIEKSQIEVSIGPTSALDSTYQPC